MRKSVKTLAVASAAAVFLTGCVSSADRVSENLSRDAEEFRVDRRIVAVNTFDGEILLLVEGRCSLEFGNPVTVTCKEGDNAFKKHYYNTPDNVFWSSTQLEGQPSDEFRSTILLKPENILPNFDMETSIDVENDGDVNN